MKKIIMSFIFVAAFVMAGTASAKEMKLAHANLQKALNDSAAGTAAKNALQEEAKKLEEQLNVKQESLKKMKSEMDKMAAVWTKEARDLKEAEFRVKNQEFQKQYMDFGEELNKKKQEREAQIINELRAIVEDMAKKKGYTYVFERSLGGLLYAPSQDDITDEVIKLYDERFKSGGK
ncbi:MAG: OmpH family outer membrane protein [Deltaproteobacteria bacterium]|nr:OmpH family outer membrane protein [Deltaproteobacteria bacterium]